MRRGIVLLGIAVLVSWEASGGAPVMPSKMTVNRPAQFALWRSPAEILWPNMPSGVRYELRGESESVTLHPGADARLEVPPLNLSRWITEPLLLVALGPKGQELACARILLHGLLDQSFSWEGSLGITWRGTVPEFRLWAPTARSVRLLILDTGGHRIIPMERQGSTWHAKGEHSWKGLGYLFEVTVFDPREETFLTHRVADPWSVALAADSSHGLVVNPDDWSPAGWDQFRPARRTARPVTIYETHLRDFTVGDPELSPSLRGKFEGFARAGSVHERHLRELAQAGVTHLHLLPLNDFGSVPETGAVNPTEQRRGSSSTAPQEELDRVRHQDAYNWGYDPVHWLAPEGSYSVNPSSPERIRELRALVMRLDRLGLGLVPDVVFNHTFASGTEPFSVLDRIVPAYFYRLRPDGSPHRSSCCPDTASERRMMEKLITDALLHWLRTYRPAGFRFDLMNLHTKAMMERIRDRLRQEDPDLLLYGEAWPFGSLEETLPGSAFFQTRSYGTGIGSFNDRMRDAIRGGNTGSSGKSDQGWATGLWWDFNHEPANRDTPPSPEAQAERLAFWSDVIRFGVAGNLRDYPLEDFRGENVTGGRHFFRDQPTAWSASPRETVNYVSAHDGYALHDAVAAKIPFVTPSRLSPTKAHILALATVALSQGAAFFEGGSELLRSKSGDADSYDSGDWFNRIDFSFSGNNWGVGLPPHWRNLGDWSFWKPRLDSGSLGTSTDEILSAKKFFLAYLRIRSSGDHFRIPTLGEMRDRLIFLRNHASAPGLIAWTIQSDAGNLLLLLNPAPEPQAFLSPVIQSSRWKIHSELRELGVTATLGKSQVIVPSQTALVLQGTEK